MVLRPLILCVAVSVLCVGSVYAQYGNRNRTTSVRSQSVNKADAARYSTANRSRGTEPGDKRARTPVVEFNRDVPRSQIVSYNSRELALAGDPKGSSYVQSLDGEWKVKNIPAGTTLDSVLLRPGCDMSVWSTVTVPQRHAQKASVSVYRHEFKMPFAWVDREIFVYVGGVQSSFEVFVNGKKVGCFTDPKSASEFDVTRYVVEGKNHLALVVRADGETSVLQDNLPVDGTAIQRSVYVHAQPKLRIRDYVYGVSFNEFNNDGTLFFGAVMKSHLLNVRDVKVYLELYSPEGEQIYHAVQDVSLNMRREDTVKFYVPMKDMEAWSHEAPNLYTVVLRSQHEGRFSEYEAVKVGLRTAGIKDGEFLVNGEKVVLRAVKYNPEKSTSVQSDMERFKRAGVNTIIVADYPQNDDFYGLCDRYGMYVCNQANIDSRDSGTSREVGGTPGNNPVWENAYKQRLMSMYHSSQIHPSVVMFSLGNEAGQGYNLYESFLRLKKTERNRPIVYEAAGGEWNTEVLISGDGSPVVKGVGKDNRPEIVYRDISWWERPENQLKSRVEMRLDGAKDVEVINHSQFDDLRNSVLRYEIMREGKKKALYSGELSLRVLPGKSEVVKIPVEIKKGRYVMHVEVVSPKQYDSKIGENMLHVVL